MQSGIVHLENQRGGQHHFNLVDPMQEGGDCIGLGPVYGKTEDVRFTQSDIQFAQQTWHFIEQVGSDIGPGDLPWEIHMELNVRSFVNDLVKDNHKLIAQEIHLSISDDFDELLFFAGELTKET